MFNSTISLGRFFTSLICVLLLIAPDSFGQIIKNYPTSQINSSFSECSSCVSLLATNPEFSINSDTTSAAYLQADRNSGITGQGWEQLEYSISKSSDNDFLYIRMNVSNRPGEADVRAGAANTNEGGTVVNLSYLGTAVPAGNIEIKQFTDRHNNIWYRLKTANNYDKLSIRVTSKNYGFNIDDNKRHAYIYAIYNTTGNATLDDCGTPAFVSFEGSVDGVPLAAPTTARLGEAIDGDFVSHTSGVLAGLANIGAPKWNYTVLFDGLSGATSTVKLTIGRGVNVVALSGVRYRLFYIRNGVEFDSTPWTTMQVIGLLGINAYAPLEFFHEAPGAFDGVRLEVEVPGVSLVGEYVRVYDIRRTVAAPVISGSGSSTIDVTENTVGTIKIAGTGTQYIWNQGTSYTDTETSQTGYYLNKLTGLLGVTPGTASSVPMRTLSELSFGPVTSDTVLFVRSIRAACPTDTSASYMINVRAVAAPLPVKISQIGVVRSGSNSLLTWTTTEELNNNYFEVLRSENGLDWTSIGKVSSNSADGSSDVQQSYQYVDASPLSGLNYYKLVQHDFDGAENQSRIISIHMEGATEGKTLVYPNPATGYFKVAAEKGSVIILYDVFGRIIEEKVVTFSAEDVEFHVGHLPIGNYFVNIVKDGVVRKHIIGIQQ